MYLPKFICSDLNSNVIIFVGGTLGINALIKKKKRPLRDLFPHIFPPCEDTVRRLKSMNQEAGLLQTKKHLEACSWTFQPPKL